MTFGTEPVTREGHLAEKGFVKVRALYNVLVRFDRSDEWISPERFHRLVRDKLHVGTQVIRETYREISATGHTQHVERFVLPEVDN